MRLPPSRRTPRARRFSRNSGGSAAWSRNYSYPTVWTATSGRDELTVTMLAGVPPRGRATYEAAVNGRVVGAFPSLAAAQDAMETGVAPRRDVVAMIPDPPETRAMEEASTTMGAALLSGRPDVLVSKETVKEERDWSNYQRDIFTFVAQGTGNAVIEAVAGSGKTTVIMEALNHIPPHKSILILAFNKSIEKELKTRVPKDRDVVVRTLTGHGYTFLRQHWSARYVNDGFSKLRDNTVIMDAVGRDDIGTVKGSLKTFWKPFTDLVGLCQSYLARTDEEITAIQNDHRKLVDSKTEYAEDWEARTATNTYTHADVLRWVKAALRSQLTEPSGVDYGRTHFRGSDAEYNTSTGKGTKPFISFRDMSYVPAMNPTWMPDQFFDFVFVDETQDTDVSQLSLVLRSVKPGGRIIVVGDRRQSIYAFRGADDDAIPRMTRELNAKILPLSVSYRVTGCAAEEARKVVPTFEIPKNAPPGICEDVDATKMTQTWEVGDIVISRRNDVMLPLAMKALRDRKIPYIMGDENQIPNLLKDVLNKIRRLMAGKRDIDSFREYLNRWADEERERAIKMIVKRRVESGKWRGDPYEDVEEDALYVRVGTIEGALWNYENTGLSQMRDVKTVDDLYKFIDAIAPSETEIARMDPEKFKAMLAKRIVFTSAHKIKGGEGRRIFILEETFGFNRAGKVSKRRLSAKELIQEQNLWYVAVTRVKYERGDTKRGIPPRDGELFYVYGLEYAIGKFGKEVDGES